MTFQEKAACSTCVDACPDCRRQRVETLRWMHRGEHLIPCGQHGELSEAEYGARRRPAVPFPVPYDEALTLSLFPPRAGSLTEQSGQVIAKIRAGKNRPRVEAKDGETPLVARITKTAPPNTSTKTGGTYRHPSGQAYAGDNPA